MQTYTSQLRAQGVCCIRASFVPLTGWQSAKGMAGFSTSVILVSVLCQLTVTETSRNPTEVVGALGGSVTFPLNFTEKHVDIIIWTFKTVSLAIVTKDNVKVLPSSNKNIVFPNGSYSMKLSQLKKNDSGIYRAEIHGTASSQAPFIQEYVLYVYEYLSRPRVTMDEQDKNGTCNTNLTCSVDGGGENVTYSWKAIEQGANAFHDGATLPISWRPGEKDKTLICTARNPISHNSSIPISVKNICEDAAKDLNSSSLILYILPVCIVLSAMVLIVPFMWTKKGKGSKEDTERVDNLQEKPNFCPQRRHTENETIPDTNEMSLGEATESTLYSTVQISKAVKNPSSLTEMPHMPRPLSYQNVM